MPLLIEESKTFTCRHSMDYTDPEENPKPAGNPKRSAALFLLKTREEGRLTQTALVVHSTSSLCEQVISNLKAQASQVIQKVGLNEVDQKTVLDSLGSISCDPFEGLRTEYKQKKFYKETSTTW